MRGNNKAYRKPGYKKVLTLLYDSAYSVVFSCPLMAIWMTMMRKRTSMSATMKVRMAATHSSFPAASRKMTTAA